MLTETGNGGAKLQNSDRSDPLKYVREEGGFSFQALDDEDSEVERYRLDRYHEDDGRHPPLDEEVDKEDSVQNKEVDVNEILRCEGDEDPTDSHCPRQRNVLSKLVITESIYPQRMAQDRVFFYQ